MYEKSGYGEYFGESNIFKKQGISYMGNIYAGGGLNSDNEVTKCMAIKKSDF